MYTDQEKEIFLYLFKLQESGVTNMFGATRYLRRRFPLVASSKAEELLDRWMQNYETIHKDLVQPATPISQSPSVPSLS
jgi:hypothetical protein